MKVLGILNFEPAYVRVTGIDDYRPISASSFLGRYRVLDFMVSNFTNSGFNNIHLFVKERPRSTIEHVCGTDYNLNPKKGSILIQTGEKTYSNQLYNTDIAAFDANMFYLCEKQADFVVIAPTHFIYIQDFAELLAAHQNSGNDITLLTQNVSGTDRLFSLCDTVKTEAGGRVTAMERNSGKYKHRQLYLEACVLSHRLFVNLVRKAQETSSLYWWDDILKDSLAEYQVGSYQHRGYVACMNTLQAYYEANMELCSADKLAQLIHPHWPIYTLTHDTCPTIYRRGASVKNSAVGNGCEIEGHVNHSLIGRKVKIGKGSFVDHCLLLPGCSIGENVHLSYAIVDRHANVSIAKEIHGAVQEPFYVKRGDRI